MRTFFDDSARDYDIQFTETAIGRLQRRRVWDVLEKKILPESAKSKILEVNCGTGEDAIWLAKKGFDVIASDISKEMIENASKKINLPNLRFERIAFSEVRNYTEKQSLDCIFSNFGGLNCIHPHEFSAFLEASADSLKQDGSLILVIMTQVLYLGDVVLLIQKTFIGFQALRNNSKS
jgi:cyclopropane fatty-acyl-phospholipid synthase-like methyltransferase